MKFIFKKALSLLPSALTHCLFETQNKKTKTESPRKVFSSNLGSSASIDVLALYLHGRDEHSPVEYSPIIS